MKLVDVKAHMTAEQQSILEELRGVLAGETQSSVVHWADATFGPTTLRAAFRRAKMEWAELDVAHGIGDDLEGELADVLITLYRVADRVGCDLHSEVDRKMAINRARKWIVGPDGTGQHQ